MEPHVQYNRLADLLSVLTRNGERYYAAPFNRQMKVLKRKTDRAIIGVQIPFASQLAAKAATSFHVTNGQVNLATLIYGATAADSLDVVADFLKQTQKVRLPLSMFDNAGTTSAAA